MFSIICTFHGIYWDIATYKAQGQELDTCWWAKVGTVSGLEELLDYLGR